MGEQELRRRWIRIYKGYISRLALGGRHQENGVVEQVVKILEERFSGLVDQGGRPIDEDRIRDWIDYKDEKSLYNQIIGPMIDEVHASFLEENGISPRRPRKKIRPHTKTASSG